MTSKSEQPAKPTITQYGYWQSTLTAESIFNAGETVSCPKPSPLGVFYLCTVVEENNQIALMFNSFKGEQRRVSPRGMNIRSTVHEYGGLAYGFNDQYVFYCNFADQRIVRQAFNQHKLIAGEAIKLTPDSDGKLRYCDFLVDDNHNRLICVQEDHRDDTCQPVNSLVSIDFENEAEVEILFQGSDFVTTPALSIDGCWLAFQTWDHPNMPWDNTQIRVVSLDKKGNLGEMNQIPHPPPYPGTDPAQGSLLQPKFSPDGYLYFIADWTDWWNLYRLDLSCQNWQVEAVYPIDSECCPPQWQTGHSNYSFTTDGKLVCSINQNCFWQLLELDPNSGTATTLVQELGSLEFIHCQENQVIYLAATSSTPPAVYKIALANQNLSIQTVYRPVSQLKFDQDALARPEHFQFPSANGSHAFGIFYLPTNTRYRGPDNALPPVLVNVHGGPSSSARTAFNPSLQFWTSRGFAIFDVNHRGSTGYGRKFRQLLYPNWGLVDLEDIIHGIKYLIQQNKVDKDKIAIRGGSAGGYAVLAALSKSQLFSAGTSYYGVSDLEMLAKDTHKFESHYLNQLIGPYPDAREEYWQRSPIHRIDQINAPVLLLQGALDKVVPPNQAEAIYHQLHAKNPATQYISFPSEAHGFRQPENQIAALEAELTFYQKNLI